MINNYVKIDSSRSTELQLIRKGFFKPVYTLTDGQFEYGTLSCRDIWQREKNIITSDGEWIVRCIGFLGKETLIIDALKSEVVGKITRNGWGTKTAIEMNNGFNAALTCGKGFFSRTLNWTNDQYGDCIQVKTTCKCTRPFTVSIDQELAKTKFPLALITLIGVNLVLLRQAEAAAIAT
jgi:hypothetical protein